MADLLPDRHRLEIQYKLGHFNSFCGHVKKVKKKKKRFVNFSNTYYSNQYVQNNIILILNCKIINKLSIFNFL